MAFEEQNTRASIEIHLLLKYLIFVVKMCINLNDIQYYLANWFFRELIFIETKYKIVSEIFLAF